MRMQRSVIPGLLLLSVLAGSGACDRSPTGPSFTVRPQRGTPGPGLNLPPVYAEITLQSISPAPGATLLMVDCGHEAGRGPGLDYCTQDLRAVFSVAADRDMPNVALRVTFWADGRPCAVAMSEAVSLASHISAEVRTTGVEYVVKDVSAATGLGCSRPPVATTTMVVELMDMSQGSGVSEVTKDFPVGYRFIVE